MVESKGLNKERAGGDGEDKRKESKIKKTKKRKASPEQEELTLKKKKKKNEKVFDLPGQKRPPPNEVGSFFLQLSIVLFIAFHICVKI